LSSTNVLHSELLHSEFRQRTEVVRVPPYQPRSSYKQQSPPPSFQANVQARARLWWLTS